MTEIYFLLGIHNHQPVGNFEHVIENVYNKSYKPFINLLYDYPNIKFSLHCSGILWDFFKQKHKEYIEKVKDMVKRGQVEILSGGYYEPILSSIPQVDRVGQIKMMNEFIERTFDFEPKGLWLTERVWEQSVVKDIVGTGISYTLIDDYNFFSAGIKREELFDYYYTEEEGYLLYLFPISQTLRYYIPFKPVNDVINFFGSFNRSEKNDLISITMGDDGEKFGEWPKTYEHVYEKMWLKDFLNEITKNSSWLKTTTFSDYISKKKPRGRVYIPTSSYFEMGEWSLFEPTQEMFIDLMKEISQMENRDKCLQFLKGGFWKNFFAKYVESNNMHKKMLYVSKKLNKLKDKKDAFSNLYQAQCNCAYWHGVFGGLYLPHLRDAVYENLILAQKQIETDCNPVMKDLDVDGTSEILLKSKHLYLYVKPNYGGSVFELDLLRINKNLLNVLTRRKEAYHRKLNEIKKTDMDKQENIASASDLVKEQGLQKYINYDWYNRYSFLDHFLHPETVFEDFCKCQYGEQGDFTIEPYKVEQADSNLLSLYREGNVWVRDERIPVLVKKQFVINCNLLVNYIIKNLSQKKVFLRFLVEMNLMVDYNKKEKIGEIFTNKLKMYDKSKNLTVELLFPLKTKMWLFPIYTVSLSESGMEKTYQGLSASSLFEFEVGANEDYRFDLSMNFIYE